MLRGHAAFGAAEGPGDAFFGEAGDFELVEEVAGGVVGACHAEVEEFERLGCLGFGDADALGLLGSWYKGWLWMGGAYQVAGNDVYTQSFEAEIVEDLVETVPPEERAVSILTHRQLIMVVARQTFQSMRMLEYSPWGTLRRLHEKVHRANIQLFKTAEGFEELGNTQTNSSGIEHALILVRGSGFFVVALEGFQIDASRSVSQSSEEFEHAATVL